MAVGAGLQFRKLQHGISSVIISSLMHLILLPIISFFLVTVLDGSLIYQKTALLYTAIPVSVSSFILARKMGGDYKIMAMIITFQTVLSIFTIPLTLSLFFR
jgi:predicted permease